MYKPPMRTVHKGPHLFAPVATWQGKERGVVMYDVCGAHLTCLNPLSQQGGRSKETSLPLNFQHRLCLAIRILASVYLVLCAV